MALTNLTKVGASQKTANLETIKDSGGNVRAHATTSGLVITGILTATSFDGVSESDTQRVLNGHTMYEVDNLYTISDDVTITRASSNPGVVYIKETDVVINNSKELIIGDGEELVLDAYQLG
tara:strand:- start:389 stop:754 length:366 start_codon:yes stop_codon:yes gene_type:complete